MTAYAASPNRQNHYLLMAALALALVIAGVGVVTGTRTHADGRHSADVVTPAQIRAQFEKAPKVEKYYSASKDQVLLLTPLPGTSLLGGMFLTALNKKPVYEITVFAATRVRWDYIIFRDGYRRIP